MTNPLECFKRAEADKEALLEQFHGGLREDMKVEFVQQLRELANDLKLTLPKDYTLGGDTLNVCICCGNLFKTKNPGVEYCSDKDCQKLKWEEIRTGEEQRRQRAVKEALDKIRSLGFSIRKLTKQELREKFGSYSDAVLSVNGLFTRVFPVRRRKTPVRWLFGGNRAVINDPANFDIIILAKVSDDPSERTVFRVLRRRAFYKHAKEGDKMDTYYINETDIPNSFVDNWDVFRCVS